MHPGKPGRCLAVHQRVGTISKVDGFKVDGCGSGAQIARYVIGRANGAVFTVVNVHGSSGFKADDFDCRVGQLEQVSVDLGDGEPAANGARNRILGDLNTDPGRAAGVDSSAGRWSEHVSGDPFCLLSDSLGFSNRPKWRQGGSAGPDSAGGSPHRGPPRGG